MLATQLDLVTHPVPDALLQAFQRRVDQLQPSINCLTEDGRHAVMNGIDITGRCMDLLTDALRIAEHCGVATHNKAVDHPECDILAAGIVDWHTDESACCWSKRLLVAYPAIEGFVLQIAHARFDEVGESDIDAAVDANPDQMVRKRIPLRPGTVIFLDHEIFHRVVFEGDTAQLTSSPATLFFDFGIN